MTNTARPEWNPTLMWTLGRVFQNEGIPVREDMTDDGIRRVLEQNWNVTHCDFYFCAESAQEVDGYLGNVVVHLTRADYEALLEKLCNSQRSLQDAEDFTASTELALTELFRQGAADRLLTNRHNGVPRSARNCSQYLISWVCAESGPVWFDVTLIS